MISHDILLENFGGLELTLGEDNFISCVAYLDPGKLQLLMNLLNPRLSPEHTYTHYACNVFGCNMSN